MAKKSAVDLYQALKREIEYNKQMVELRKNIPSIGETITIIEYRSEKGPRGNVDKEFDVTVIAHYSDYMLCEVHRGCAIYKECFAYIDFIPNYLQTRKRYSYGTLQNI